MRRNKEADRVLLALYTFELIELGEKLARIKLLLRVANGLNTVLNRRLKLELQIKETGVQKNLQESTSIGLVAFDDAIGLSASMHRNIIEVETMIIELGGTEKLQIEPFLFESCPHTEVRIVVSDFDSIAKSELAHRFSVLTKKYRELSR